MKQKSESLRGFSLIELIVVLAGLGILSSLAISNVVKYLDYAKVDEAKTLLNAAAAECLQGLRGRSDPETFLTRPLFDAKNAANEDLKDILTEERLATTGYRFSNDAKSCRKTTIVAISDADTSRRLPGLSFAINTNGILTKCATDDGSDTESAAVSWAGKCVIKGEVLAEWQQYDALISATKAACINDMNAWLNDHNNRGKYNRAWDESATSGCPDAPPKVENENCTPNGCNQTIYGYKGVIVSTGDTAKARKDYEDYVEVQKGKDCAEALRALRNENTHTTEDGIAVGKCDGDIYWYYRGEEVSQETWRTEMCAENKEKLLTTTHSGPVEYCDVEPIYIIGGEEVFPHPASREDAKAMFDKRLAEDKDAQCTQALNNDAVTKRNGGPYQSPTPSEMTDPKGNDCGETYWYCEGKIHREPGSKEKYDNDNNCKNIPPPKDCGPKPYYFCDQPDKYDHARCQTYSKCLGRIE